MLHATIALDADVNEATTNRVHVAVVPFVCVYGKNVFLLLLYDAIRPRRSSQMTLYTANTKPAPFRKVDCYPTQQ